MVVKVGMELCHRRTQPTSAPFLQHLQGRSLFPCPIHSNASQLFRRRNEEKRSPQPNRPLNAQLKAVAPRLIATDPPKKKKFGGFL